MLLHFKLFHLFSLFWLREPLQQKWHSVSWRFVTFLLRSHNDTWALLLRKTEMHTVPNVKIELSCFKRYFLPPPWRLYFRFKLFICYGLSTELRNNCWSNFNETWWNTVARKPRKNPLHFGANLKHSRFTNYFFLLGEIWPCGN